jgi:hypothetical protein
MNLSRADCRRKHTGRESHRIRGLLVSSPWSRSIPYNGNLHKGSCSVAANPGSIRSEKLINAGM